MAAQRIVLTSPWKLGLFVFLLVVGCGFGLIYAYLEFFGGSLDFQNETMLRVFYGVCGGVALLGLLGYMSVVTASRPLDGVIRGGKRREKLMKKLADVDDPRDIDPEDVDDPQLAKILERWVDDSSAALSAQMAIANQREALTALAARVHTASSEPELELAAREEDDADMAPLINAINAYVQGVRSASPEPQPTSIPPSGPSAELVGLWREAAVDFGRHEQQLRGFASSVASSSEELNRRATVARGAGSGVANSDLNELCRRNAQRMGELRQKLEELAEESNRHAINAALQVSRLGESGQDLLTVTEEIRALSTRYQRLVADLRLCENDQEATLAELAEVTGSETGGSQSLSPEMIEKLAMVLDQNSGGIQEIASNLRNAVQRLASAIDPASMPTPQTSGPISVPSPVLQAGGDSGAEQIYDLADFGATEITDDSEDAGPIYDLLDFGAVQI